MPKENTHNTVSKATSRSVNKSAISTIAAVILTAIIVGSVAVGATYAYFALQSAPAQQLVTQPKPALQKFKASVYAATLENFFLIEDAGKDRGFYASRGLDPEWVTIADRTLAADLKEQVSSGIRIGLSIPSEVLIARSNGVPVKIVAATLGGAPNVIYVKPESEIISLKDLDGKKIGVVGSAGAVGARIVLYLNGKFGIKAEPVFLGNLTNSVVALKLGRVDAFTAADGAALRLVDAGELRIAVRIFDYIPKPIASNVIFAAEDLIEQNPDLVKRFVEATLETVKYIKDNPNYAAELYMKRTNAPRDLAVKAVSQWDWQPGGRGSGSDLITAIANNWQYNKDSGAIPASISLKAEEAIDIRFLP